MNIRSPFYWTLQRQVAFMVLFCGLVIFISTSILYVRNQHRIQALQEAQRAEQARLSQNVIENNLRLLDIYARDYGFWDDMADHVAARDIVWLDEVFEGSLKTYSARAIWILTAEKEVLYSEFLPEQSSIPLPITPEELNEISVHDTVRGFYTQNEEGLTSVRVAPIKYNLATEKNNSPSGYFVIARVLDEEFVSTVEKLISADVSIETQRNETDQSIDIPFSDWNTTTIGYAVFMFPQDLVQGFAGALGDQQQHVIVVAIISLFVCGFLLNFWIVRPASRLIQKLSTCTDENCILPTSKSEFVILDTLVNDYLSQRKVLLEKTTQLDKANADLTRELEATKKLGQAVDASTDAIIITDKEGKIEYTNPAWQKLNGYTLDEVKGKNPNILQSGKTPDTLYERMWKTILTGSPFITEEIVNKRKDGTEYAAYLSIFPVMNGQNIHFFVAIQQDISLRKEVDRMKTEFISLVSHQLRTPLSAIRWFSEILLTQKQGPLNAKQLEIVDTIHFSSLKMNDLVSSLLNITRLESGRIMIEPIQTDLHVFIADLIRELKPRIDNKHLSLEINLAPDLPQIFIDQKLCREIYINLLTNAIKYTPEFGTITLKIEKNKETLLSSVQDTGYGIPSREQQKVFQRFYRGENVTKREPDGSGLGLYLVKEIVTASNGSIWFESIEGKGTTFFFTIPIWGMEGKKGEVSLNPTQVV